MIKTVVIRDEYESKIVPGASFGELSNIPPPDANEYSLPKISTPE